MRSRPAAPFPAAPASGFSVNDEKREAATMAIYTKGGDGGMTSLATGERVSKTDVRVVAYGTADELQAQLGMARAFIEDAQANEDVAHLERKLYDAMAELSSPGAPARITVEDVVWLEGRIDHYVPQKFRFAVPGDDVPSAALHLARTVARRCERWVLALHDEVPLSAELLAFFNRISDFCYAMAESAAAGWHVNDTH